MKQQPTRTDRGTLIIKRALGLHLALVLAACGCASNPEGRGKDGSNRDFTFFLLSDVHIGVENLKATPPVTREETLQKARANLELMQRLVGTTYPTQGAFAELRLEKVATPKALIVLGDLTDGHKEPARAAEQWQGFDSLYPATGLRFGEKAVPVFALAGNHDGEIAGPQRVGLVARNRQLKREKLVTALSTNDVHFALNWSGVHFIGLGLCPADGTDAETPFKYGKPGPGSWNDPQGALTFLKDYLGKHVGKSGEPIVLMHHYGFDGFSVNDWLWWTPKQRRELYQLLQNYNVAAIFHGHNHHAEHYKWPDPKLHAADLQIYFDGNPPANFRQFDVVSCGLITWVMRVQGDRLVAAHYKPDGWSKNPADYFIKSLKP